MWHEDWTASDHPRLSSLMRRLKIPWEFGELVLAAIFFAVVLLLLAIRSVIEWFVGG